VDGITPAGDTFHQIGANQSADLVSVPEELDLIRRQDTVVQVTRTDYVARRRLSHRSTPEQAPCDVLGPSFRRNAPTHQGFRRNRLSAQSFE